MEIKRPGDVQLSAEYSSTALNTAANTAKEALFKPKTKQAGEESLYSALGAEFSAVPKEDNTNVPTNDSKKQNPFQPNLPRLTDGFKITADDDSYSYTKKTDNGGQITSLYTSKGEFAGTKTSQYYPNGKESYSDSYDAENRLTGSTDYYPDGSLKSMASYNWEDGIYEKFTYNSRGEITAYEMTENGKGIHRLFETQDGKTVCVNETNIKSNFVVNKKSEVEQQENTAPVNDMQSGKPLRRITEGEKEVYTENTYIIAEKNAHGKNVYASEYKNDGTFHGTITWEYNDNGRVVSDKFYDKTDNLKSLYEYSYYPDGKKLTFENKVFAADGKISEHYKTEYDRNGNVIVGEYVIDGKGKRITYNNEKNVAPIEEPIESISDEDKNRGINKTDNGKTEYQYYSTGAKKKEVIYDKNGVVTGVNLFNEDGSLKKAIHYIDGKAVL